MDASLSELETSKLASEFKITVREVLAVVEHFREKNVPTTSVSPVKRAAVVDDDDDAVSWTIEDGISDEVRAQVCCGALHATLVLPKGYQKLQEYVIYHDGSKVTPATLERDAGKGASKNWKYTVRVVDADGSAGRVLKKWLDDTGFHPKGFDPKAPPVKRDGATKKAKAKLAKEKKEKEKEKAKKSSSESKHESNHESKHTHKQQPERTLFEQQLDNFLDSDGGVNLETNVPKVVWMMKNVMSNAEKSLVIRVLHRTKLVYLKSFVAGNGLAVMKKWFETAKAEYKSSLLLKMLLTLERMPVSVDALKSTGWGKTVSKLQKYAPPAKEFDERRSKEENDEATKTALDLVRRVKEQAAVVKSRWERLVLKESEQREAEGLTLKNAVKEKAKASMSGVKREAPSVGTTASDAKRTKVDASSQKPVADSTKIAVTKVARPTTTTTIVKTQGSTKNTGLSFGGINIRGMSNPERPAGLVKGAKGTNASTKPKAPPPPAAPMLFKKKPSKRAAKGVTWPNSHDSLEMAKFFYKSDPPAACNPDPDVVAKLVQAPAHSAREIESDEKLAAAEMEAREDEEDEDEDDEDDEAAVAKARERQERELAAEARAAQLTRQRRLNEMRAKIKWKAPRRVPYGDDVEIGKGEESQEANRLNDIANRTKEVTFKKGAVPDSAKEAPDANSAKNSDDANVPEIPLLHKMTPEQQRQQEQQQRLMQQQQQHMVPPHLRMHGAGPMPPMPPQGFGLPPAPPPPPGGVDAAALQALLNSVQSNPALMANLGKAGGAPGAPRPQVGNLCAFFNSPAGCHRGGQCKFAHERVPNINQGAFPFLKR